METLRYLAVWMRHLHDESQEALRLAPLIIAFLRAARFLDPSMHDELEALIDDLRLESLGAKKVEEPEEEPPQAFGRKQNKYYARME